MFENDKNENGMRQLLSQGVPFVVNNIQLRGAYDPNYFINKYHGESCSIHYVNTGQVEKTTVDKYFRTFGDLRPSNARAKLKVNPSSCLRFLWPNILAGLAAGGRLPDKIWGIVRCIHGCYSFPGYNESQRSSQSGGALSNERRPPGLRYACLTLTVLPY